MCVNEAKKTEEKVPQREPILHFMETVSGKALPAKVSEEEKENYKENVNHALATLTKREEVVLRLYFGLDDGRCRTIGEVAQEFCVPDEQIRQIVAAALRKFQHPSRRAILMGREPDEDD